MTTSSPPSSDGATHHETPSTNMTTHRETPSTNATTFSPETVGTSNSTTFPQVCFNLSITTDGPTPTLSVVAPWVFPFPHFPRPLLIILIEMVIYSVMSLRLA